MESGALKTLVVKSPSGNIELVLPEEGGVNFALEEVFRQECYRPIPGIGEVKLVVDIGANVGLAATYFRSHYPKADIVAFEPDERAFGFLKKNAQALGRCQVFHYGLSSSDREAELFLGGSSVHTSTKRSKESSQVRTIELKDAHAAIASVCASTVDILKIDTEGSEIPILKSLSKSFLPSVEVIYLEFHSHADRLEIDTMLSSTHLLWRAEIDGVHRGLLTYVNRNSPALRNAYEPLC